MRRCRRRLTAGAGRPDRRAERPACSWPACRCAGRRDVGGFVAAFTGSHRYVLDTWPRRSSSGSRDQVRDFLLETSVLDRLSGELCDAVTGRPGSQALLEQAERAGLFVLPLDEARGWWRYHHLFADLLRARLQQEQPGRVLELHRNAAAWYAGRGLADDAIRHAAAAGELTWAAQLIEQHFDETFYLRGRGGDVPPVAGGAARRLVRSRPRLLVAQAFLASPLAAERRSEPLLDEAEQADAGAADEPFEPTDRPGGQHLGERPRADRALPGLPRPVPR